MRNHDLTKHDEAHYLENKELREQYETKLKVFFSENSIIPGTPYPVETIRDMLLREGIPYYVFEHAYHVSYSTMDMKCESKLLSAVLHSVYVRGRMDEHAGRSHAARYEFGRKFYVNKTTGMIDVLEPTNVVTFFVKRRRK